MPQGRVKTGAHVYAETGFQGGAPTTMKPRHGYEHPLA